MPDEQPNGWQAPDWFKRYLWIVLAVLVFFAASTLQAVIIAEFGGQPVPVPVPPVGEVRPVVMAPADDPPPNAFGWVNDPAEVRAVQATMPQPVFAETPAGKNDDPLPKSVYLWDAYRQLFAGQKPPAHDQNPVGSCVSFGASRAYERSLAVQIRRGDPFEFKHMAEEVIYAFSRVEIGGGRIRGDGSVGAWAAKGYTEKGALPRGVYGRYDLTRYDPDRCRAWGRSGVPDDLEPDAEKFRAGACTQVSSWESAKRALAQGYGVFVCSDQGFARQRDQNGVCRAQGSWSHCLSLDGYHVTDDGREYGHIENSWGPYYHVGPVGWGDPNTAGFWAESRVIDRMLSQGDSWAVSAVQGFPSQKLLDWLVHVRPDRGFDDAIRDRLAVGRAADAGLAW